MLAAINAARAARGAGPLQADGRLVTAARQHAADIGQHPGLLHIGSDGMTIEARLRRAGYQAARWGEVVGWGWQGEIAPMLDWWLQSADHVGYVLDPTMTEVGVGYATGLGPWGHYWCVDFARPSAEERPAPPGVEPDAPPPHVAYVPIVTGGGG